MTGATLAPGETRNATVIRPCFRKELQTKCSIWFAIRGMMSLEFGRHKLSQVKFADEPQLIVT